MAKNNNTNQGLDNIINTSPLIINVYNKIKNINDNISQYQVLIRNFIPKQNRKTIKERLFN